MALHHLLILLLVPQHLLQEGLGVFDDGGVLLVAVLGREVAELDLEPGEVVPRQGDRPVHLGGVDWDGELVVHLLVLLYLLVFLFLLLLVEEILSYISPLVCLSHLPHHRVLLLKQLLLHLIREQLLLLLQLALTLFMLQQLQQVLVLIILIGQRQIRRSQARPQPT